MVMYHGKNGKKITPKKQTQDDVSPYNLPRRWSKGNFNHFFREPNTRTRLWAKIGTTRLASFIGRFGTFVMKPRYSLVGGFNPVEKY